MGVLGLPAKHSTQPRSKQDDQPFDPRSATRVIEQTAHYFFLSRRLALAWMRLRVALEIRPRLYCWVARAFALAARPRVSIGYLRLPGSPNDDLGSRRRCFAVSLRLLATALLLPLGAAGAAGVGDSRRSRLRHALAPESVVLRPVLDLLPGHGLVIGRVRARYLARLGPTESPMGDLTAGRDRPDAALGATRLERGHLDLVVLRGASSWSDRHGAKPTARCAGQPQDGPSLSILALARAARSTDRAC